MLKKGFYFGLRGKLIAIITIVVIVATGTVGVISVYSMRSEMEKQIMDSQILLANSFSEEVIQFFEDAKGMVRTAAQLPAVRDVSSIPLIRDDIKGVPQDEDVPKRDVMNYIIDSYGDFQYMEQVTPDVGNNIVIEPYQYQLDLTQLDFGHRDWFKGALNKMDAHVSEVYISSSLQAPVIAVSHPTVDDDGKPSAVLMGALTLDRLNDLCRQLTFGKTGHAYMADQLGTLAAHPNSEYTEGLKSVLDVPMVKKAMDGEFGVGLFFDPLTQKEVLTSYMPIGDTGWSMIVVQDPDEAFAPIKATMLIIIIAAAVLLFLAVLAAIGIASSIARPVQKVNDLTVKLSEGDFTTEAEIASHDEVGQMAQNINNAVTVLRKTLQNVKETADNVSHASGEISSGNQDLSQRTEEQASSLEEIASTIEEIASSLEASSAHSVEADMLSNKTLESVQQGEIVVRDMQSAMGEITQGNQEIAEIIAKVNDIAFQTNLLALNAAVEAARAGEQGRGFAVVAAEVRNLAGHSAESAKEIEKLIKDSIVRVDKGNELMAETESVLREIIENTQKTSDVVGEITSSLKEQSSSAGDIRSAVEELNQVTQQNASLVEEIASSSENMNSEALQLIDQVDFFKLTTNDRANGSFLTRRHAEKSNKEAMKRAVPVKETAVAAVLEGEEFDFDGDDFEKF